MSNLNPMGIDQTKLLKVSLISNHDIDNDLPLFPKLVTLTGRPMGSFNLYGNTYKNIYGYSCVDPILPNEYNVYAFLGNHPNLDRYPDIDNYVDLQYNLPDKVLYINRILAKHGWLEYENVNNSDRITWRKTVAWCDESDWGMININVRGRQPLGLVCPTKFHETLDELIKLLDNMCDKLQKDLSYQTKKGK